MVTVLQVPGTLDELASTFRDGVGCTYSSPGSLELQCACEQALILPVPEDSGQKSPRGTPQPPSPMHTFRKENPLGDEPWPFFFFKAAC